MPTESPAEVNTSNNAGDNTSQVVNRPVTKIAPISLPGVVPRGTNDVVEEAPVDHVVNEDGEEERLNDAEPEPESEPEAQPKIKFMGREYASLEEAESAMKKLVASSRGAQAKADKAYAELNRRIAELETARTTPTTGPQMPEPNPEVKQFWNDVMGGFASLDTIKDPVERARQQTIVVASIVQDATERLRAEILEEFGKEFKPIKEERQRTEAETAALNKAHTAFSAVAAEANDDGSPLYPELAQAEDLDAIVSIWEQYKANGMPPGLLYHPDHIQMIIHAYRASKTGSPNIPVPETKAELPRRAAKSPTSLPPNLTKGQGKLPGMRIPGVFGRF